MNTLGFFHARNLGSIAIIVCMLGMLGGCSVRGGAHAHGGKPTEHGSHRPTPSANRHDDVQTSSGALSKGNEHEEHDQSAHADPGASTSDAAGAAGDENPGKSKKKHASKKNKADEAASGADDNRGHGNDADGVDDQNPGHKKAK